MHVFVCVPPHRCLSVSVSAFARVCLHTPVFVRVYACTCVCEHLVIYNETKMALIVINTNAIS
jgi:hypothetical protein